MPTLPSGLKLALMINHIMEPDTNWFRAPEGHFWYWTPAEENPPPFFEGQVSETTPVTAPVPLNKEAMKSYVRVCLGTADGMLYWRGEMLSEFPKYGALSEEDSLAWQKWLNRDDVNEFLDRAIEKCRIQAEVNKKASGVAVMRSSGKNHNGEYVGYKQINNPTKGYWRALKLGH